MTYEEAADILDPETRASTLALIEYYGGFRGEQTKTDAINDACNLAAKVLREFHAEVNGKPLTFEQLREMDGKPAWMDSGTRSCWGIISVDKEGLYEGIPFFNSFLGNSRFSYDTRNHALKLYRLPVSDTNRYENRIDTLESELNDLKEYVEML